MRGKEGSYDVFIVAPTERNDARALSRLRFVWPQSLFRTTIKIDLLKLTLCGPVDVAKEIAIAQGKKVMVYFSDLESVLPNAQQGQIERLAEFRRSLFAAGLCGRFSSRDQFRKLFRRHLAHAVNELRPSAPSVPAVPTPTPSGAQFAYGDHNIQAQRDVNYYAKPPVVKQVIARREGSLTPDECVRVQEMIEQLVEGTTGMTRSRAYGMWWQRLKQRFAISKYEDLDSRRMGDVAEWFKEQRAIQTRGLKTKAPDQWRRLRIGAIKSAMERMGKDNDGYYPEIARRLKMKRPFESLTDLTKTDLDRVYGLVLRDAASVG